MTANADLQSWMADYDALVHRVGLVALERRTQIEVGGADRASFLHNLCTNEVRKLAAGSGCEAFLTTVQGKTAGHVFVFVDEKSIIIDTVPGEVERILRHLDHYLVSERVSLEDRTQEWSELLLAGPGSDEFLRSFIEEPIPQTRLGHAAATIGGKTVWLRRVDLAGPVGFLISARAADIEAVRLELIEGGASPCEARAFEAARIEWGFPLYGVDIFDHNLPQEVARDRAAISFVKGCYLGQETVARIDALGHVNQTLVGIRFHGAEIPTPGLELTAAGQAAGRVTSACYSPRYGSVLAMGYARRGHGAPATRLDSAIGEAEVVALSAAQ